MAFTITHRDGGMDEGEESDIEALLAELEGDPDEEHPDVSVTHETGLSVSLFQSGLAVLENVEDGSFEPKHLVFADRTEPLSLMRLVARGDISVLEQWAWNPGYGDQA